MTTRFGATPRISSPGFPCGFHGPWRPCHIVGFRAADGVLATGTGGALLYALGGEARRLAILVVVRHQALRLGSLAQ